MSRGEETCLQRIRQIAAALEKRGNRQIPIPDLTFAQATVLTALGEAEEAWLSVRGLRDRLGIAQSTVTGLVAKLARKGYVSFSVDPADHRIHRIALTAKGTQCGEILLESARRAEEELLRNLTIPERAELRYLLGRVMDGLVCDEERRGSGAK